MSQITEHTEPTTGPEAEQAELRSIFERLSKLPRYAQPWDEFIREWGPMDPEDRDDAIYSLEVSQAVHDGTEETYSLEEVKAEFNL